MNRIYRDSGFQLELPVKHFRVDDPADRAGEGPDFSRPVPDSAVTDTTKNMLGPAVLDAAQFPYVDVRSAAVGGTRVKPEITVRITLRDVRRDFTVPVEITASPSKLEVKGRFYIRQSDFGIAPFSILGGGLRVVDQVEIDFDIIAQGVPQ